MNKALLFGGIAVIILFVVILQFSGIGILSIFTTDSPEGERLEELKQENAELKSQNEKYVVEIPDLNAKLGRIVVAQPGGLATEEERKALAVREAEQNRREKRLVRREEQLRSDRAKLESEEQNFFNERELKVEEIGEAKAIKENHERMVASLAKAEERANNWLKAIYAISIVFFVGIIALVAFLMHMAAKNRRIDMAMRTVESVNLSAQDRNLLMASLGGRIIEQPHDDDGEH